MDLEISDSIIVRDYTDEPLLCLRVTGHIEPEDVEAIREQFTNRVNHRVVVFAGGLDILPLDPDSVPVHLLRNLVEAQKEAMSTGRYRAALTDAQRFLAALDAAQEPGDVRSSEG